MTSKVEDRDHGYTALVRSLLRGDLDGPAVYVGILQDKGSETTESGITLAGYAAVNEFGSDDGHVPERSFLRSTVADNQATYERDVGEVAGRAIDAMAQGRSARRSIHEDLGRLGTKVVRDVRNKIRDLREPANAPSTLARKYPGSNPLIDTGRMRQSIQHEVDVDGSRGDS